VANAVPSVREHADVVVDHADGAGVASLLRGPLVSGATPVRPARRRVRIGAFPDGRTADVAGAQVNVLVRGETGSGKSYLAGLLAERWIQAGYSVLIVDMEGDYLGLERLHDVVVLGAGERPDGRTLLTTLRQRSVSVVLDVSELDDAAKQEYLTSLPPFVEAERATWGMPHWILVDEAHATLGEGGGIGQLFRPADRGYCLVTYHPEALSREATALLDVTITALGEHEDGTLRATLRERGTPEREFRVDGRRTPHVRHWHKYAATPLAPARWFRFRRPGGTVVAEAGDLAAFARGLSTAETEVVAHHLRHGDFSRWITGTLQDRGLAAVVAAIERELLARQATDLTRAREQIIAAVEERYLGPAGDYGPDRGVVRRPAGG
jgi:hypothetical protein